MKLKNILKVLDMMNVHADVYVRGRGDKYDSLHEMKLMDFELGIYDLDKNYTLTLEKVKEGVGDDENSDSYYPSLFVRLDEDYKE